MKGHDMANTADEIRKQIAELQDQLEQTEKQEREDALESMKALQKKFRFNQRELGYLFKARPKRSAE